MFPSSKSKTITKDGCLELRLQSAPSSNAEMYKVHSKQEVITF